MKISDQTWFSCIGVKTYVAAFCVSVMMALVLLVAAAFLPQYLIQQNVADSVEFVMQDFENNYLFDKSAASQLDVFTDVMMLRTSLTTNDRYLGSVLTNPIYTYDGLAVWEGSPETLARLAYDIPSDGVWYYARYWMGFRVVLRLALLFFNYAQIKRYTAFLFLSLFAAVICSLSRHTNSRIAFFFALSIILVRPHVMATSMQFTCCFFIAFAAMLLVPWLYRHPKWEGLFFLELGILTMYFDFYTVPLVTLGFPMVYLWILRQEGSSPGTFRTVFRNMALWFLGYGGMWLTKLTLTTLLTSENALQHGLESLLSRVGIRKDAQLDQYYSLEAAVDGLQKSIFSDNAGRVVYLLCAGILLAVVLWKVFRGHVPRENFRTAAPYLFFGSIPLIWFVITKQPIALHFFFQYRTIALTHWAAGVFLCYLLPAKSREQTK